MPQFPEGESKLFKFIENHIKYPKDALKKKIEGSVICRFVVNEDGTISDIIILRTLYPSLDNEAIRIINLMPKWIPGIQDGKIVKVYNALPIRFKLPK